jgi:glycosyltransferase involved in cell wall biosynthesis
VDAELSTDFVVTGECMTTNEALATILINNYNYGRFLAQAIDSALAQSYPNLQIIVVDDGSTDNSREVIRSFGNRVTAVFQANGGQASALNAGFSQSKGNWIVLLDSDDLFLSSKVQTLMSYAKAFPLAGVIAHNFDYCDEEGNATVFSRPTAAAVRLIDDRTKARSGKFSTYLPPTSALALRRDAAAKIFPLPQDIRISADAFIQMAALALTPVLLIPECLAIQRIHSKNSCTQRTKTADSFLADCLVTAKVAYRIKERFPFLDKIVWKMYGAIAYRLMASRSKNAKAARKAVRLEFGRLDRPLSSFYYVARGFVTTLFRDLSNAKHVR